MSVAILTRPNREVTFSPNNNTGIGEPDISDDDTEFADAPNDMGSSCESKPSLNDSNEVISSTTTKSTVTETLYAPPIAQEHSAAQTKDTSSINNNSGPNTNRGDVFEAPLDPEGGDAADDAPDPAEVDYEEKLKALRAKIKKINNHFVFRLDPAKLKTVGARKCAEALKVTVEMQRVIHKNLLMLHRLKRDGVKAIEYVRDLENTPVARCAFSSVDVNMWLYNVIEARRRSKALMACYSISYFGGKPLYRTAETRARRSYERNYPLHYGQKKFSKKETARMFELIRAQNMQFMIEAAVAKAEERLVRAPNVGNPMADFFVEAEQIQKSDFAVLEVDHPQLDFASMSKLGLPKFSASELRQHFYELRYPDKVYQLRSPDWTSSEKRTLLNIVDNHGEYKWPETARLLNEWHQKRGSTTQRTAAECLGKYTRMQHAQDLQKHIPWNEEDDQTLKKVVEIFGPRNWGLVSAYFPNRTASQCLNRYGNLSVVNKGPWTYEEDRRMILAHKAFPPDINLVSSYGYIRKKPKHHWREIAKFVKTRSHRQVRERFENAWKAAKTNAWDEGESEKFKEALEKHGVGKWVAISRELGGTRTDSQCRKYWFTLQRRKSSGNRVATRSPSSGANSLRRRPPRRCSSRYIPADNDHEPEEVDQDIGEEGDDEDEEEPSDDSSSEEGDDEDAQSDSPQEECSGQNQTGQGSDDTTEYQPITPIKSSRNTKRKRPTDAEEADWPLQSTPARSGSDVARLIRKSLDGEHLSVRATKLRKKSEAENVAEGGTMMEIAPGITLYDELPMPESPQAADAATSGVISQEQPADMPTVSNCGVTSGGNCAFPNQGDTTGLFPANNVHSHVTEPAPVEESHVDAMDISPAQDDAASDHGSGGASPMNQSASDHPKEAEVPTEGGEPVSEVAKAKRGRPKKSSKPTEEDKPKEKPPMKISKNKKPPAALKKKKMASDNSNSDSDSGSSELSDDSSYESKSKSAKSIDTCIRLSQTKHGAAGKGPSRKERAFLREQTRLEQFMLSSDKSSSPEASFSRSNKAQNGQSREERAAIWQKEQRGLSSDKPSSPEASFALSKKSERPTPSRAQKGQSRGERAFLREQARLEQLMLSSDMPSSPKASFSRSKKVESSTLSHDQKGKDKANDSVMKSQQTITHRGEENSVSSSTPNKRGRKRKSITIADARVEGEDASSIEQYEPSSASSSASKQETPKKKKKVNPPAVAPSQTNSTPRKAHQKHKPPASGRRGRGRPKRSERVEDEEGYDYDDGFHPESVPEQSDSDSDSDSDDLFHKSFREESRAVMNSFLNDMVNRIKAAVGTAAENAK